MAGVQDWVYFKASTSSTQKYLSHRKNNEIAFNRHKFSLALRYKFKKKVDVATVETKVFWTNKAWTSIGGWSDTMTFYVIVRETVPSSVL